MSDLSNFSSLSDVPSSKNGMQEADRQNLKNHIRSGKTGSLMRRNQAEEEARERNKDLWGAICNACNISAFNSNSNHGYLPETKQRRFNEISKDAANESGHGLAYVQERLPSQFKKTKIAHLIENRMHRKLAGTLALATAFMSELEVDSKLESDAIVSAIRHRVPRRIMQADAQNDSSFNDMDFDPHEHLEYEEAS